MLYLKIAGNTIVQVSRYKIQDDIVFRKILLHCLFQINSYN